MRKSLLAALAVAVLVGASAPQPAQAQPKPVIKMAVSSFDTLLDDVDFFAALAGQPNARMMAEMAIQALTGGKGLAGLDKTKPWGVIGVMGAGQSEPDGYAFIPISDLEALTGMLAPLAQENPQFQAVVEDLRKLAETSKKDPTATAKITGPMGQTVHLKYDSKGGWLFLAERPEVLTQTPADPAALLGDLDDRYDIGLSLEVANLPKTMREMFVNEMKAGAEIALEQAPDESDEEYAIRRQVTQRMIGELARMIDELQAATIGVGVDRENSKVFLELAATAKEGTSLADEMAEMSDEKTNFAGFLMPEAAVNAQICGDLATEDIEALTQLVQALETRGMERIDKEALGDQDKQAVKQLLADLVDVAEATIKKGRLDGGLVVLLDEETFTFAVGGVIAEGDKLEALLRKLTDIAREEAPDAAGAITLDVAEHQGVHFHRLSIDSAQLKNEAMVKRVGESFDVVVGLRDTAFYLAGGRNAMDTVKKIIDASAAEAGTSVPPMQLTVAATPIVELLVDLARGSDKETLSAMLEQLEAAGDKDHLTVLVRPIERGVALRLEVEDGLIKAAIPWIEKLVKGVGFPMPGVGGGGF